MSDDFLKPFLGGERASPADKEGWVGDMTLHGRAWQSISDKGVRTWVPIDSVDATPTGVDTAMPERRGGE